MSRAGECGFCVNSGYTGLGLTGYQVSILFLCISVLHTRLSVSPSALFLSLYPPPAAHPSSS